MKKPQTLWLGISLGMDNYGIHFCFNFHHKCLDALSLTHRRRATVLGDCRQLVGTYTSPSVVSCQINLYYGDLTEKKLLGICAHEATHAGEQLDDILSRWGAFRKSISRGEFRASMAGGIVNVFDLWHKSGFSPTFHNILKPEDILFSPPEFLKRRAPKAPRACVRHPRYTGVRSPSADCDCCRGIYDRKHTGEDGRND